VKKQLLDILKRDAYVKGKVRLASGKISDFYIDVRKVSISPAGVYLISHLIWKIIRDEKIDAIGGPTLGADPIVSGLCFLAYKDKKKLGAFLIRKAAKEHGTQRLIEGKDLRPGSKVIIFDDVATSGGSLINSIKVLQEKKVKVVKAVVVVDREEGARENLADLGCGLVSLFTRKDFTGR